MAFQETCKEDWAMLRAMKQSGEVKKYSPEEDMYERIEEATQAEKGLKLLEKLNEEMSQLYDGYRLAECGNILEEFAKDFGDWAYPNGSVKEEFMAVRRELFEMEGKAHELYHRVDRLVDDIESTLTDLTHQM